MSQLQKHSLYLSQVQLVLITEKIALFNTNLQFIYECQLVN